VTTQTFQPGQTVRFTTGPLGLIADENSAFFVEATAKAGDTGEYIGSHPYVDGWHMIRVGKYVCPCAPAHFEAIS
jgi:hypothetical protein